MTDAYGNIFIYFADATMHADIGNDVPVVIYCPDDDGNSIHVMTLSAFEKQFTIMCDEPEEISS